ncbi:hypothetical protein HAX54_006281 [Datura stramonium]|uniref:Uncharacterized protein n=1 Tax=Datura stramonium TaxID=4076 RepID=A0ABS8TBF8_DATST|nr:hypothetical protein [Datura stramonium]
MGSFSMACDRWKDVARRSPRREPTFSLLEEHIVKRKSFFKFLLGWVLCDSPRLSRIGKIGDLRWDSRNVISSSLHDLSSVRILVRKGGKVPVSIVVEDGVGTRREGGFGGGRGRVDPRENPRGWKLWRVYYGAKEEELYLGLF